jgi:hypothetical protein
MTREWKTVYPGYSARFYKNGRTDVRDDRSGEVVTSYSPSLQQDVRSGVVCAALSYLFGDGFKMER